MPRSDHVSDFELYVMLAIAALGDAAYGVTIATRIGDRTRRDVSLGAIYATLGRLSDKGYVLFALSEPEPIRGGRARKLVSLSAAGWRALRVTTESLDRMRDGGALPPAAGSRRRARGRPVWHACSLIGPPSLTTSRGWSRISMSCTRRSASHTAARAPTAGIGRRWSGRSRTCSVAACDADRL